MSSILARARTGGRKPGTPNHQVFEQRIVPPRCKCGSTNLRVLKRLPDQRHSGIAPDGQPYTLIARRRVKCQACGQVIAQLAYYAD